MTTNPINFAQGVNICFHKNFNSQPFDQPSTLTTKLSCNKKLQ